MGDLIIKPASSGNLKIQDQGGTERISLNTSGLTTFAANVALSDTMTGGTLASAVTFPAGHVLQVVSNSSSSNITTTSTSYVASGVNVSITPISTSNKILIMCNSGSMDYSGTASTIDLSLYKDGTSLKKFSSVSFQGGEKGSRPFVYLDSPSTTSSTTYDIYFKSGNGSQTAYLNETTGTVSIVAMEIQG